MEQRYDPQDQPVEIIEVRENLLNQPEQSDAEELATPLQAEEASEDLAALLKQEGRQRLKEIGAVFAWSGVFVTSMLFLLRYADQGKDALTIRLLICFMMIGGAGVGICSHLMRRSKQRKRSLRAAIDQTTAKQDAGSLIRSLQVENTAVRSLAKQRLTALLPTLRASDASLLSEAERKILLRYLAISPSYSGYYDIRELFSRAAYRRELDFRLSILKSLEQIGGIQELATVERLAQGLPIFHNAIQFPTVDRLAQNLPTLSSTVKFPEEMKEAAKACLPYLQIRAADQRAESQLLRAADLPSASAETLLRPAALGESLPPEQLLRAGEPHS